MVGLYSTRFEPFGLSLNSGESSDTSTVLSALNALPVLAPKSDHVVEVPTTKSAGRTMSSPDRPMACCRGPFVVSPAW